MPTRSVFEFFVHYLADEALRNNVFFADLDNLQKWGLSEPDAQVLASLEESDIFDLVLRDLSTFNSPQDLVEAIKLLLKEIGFDAPRAQGEIYHSVPDCTPSNRPVAGPRNPREAVAQASAMAAAAYGQGDIHVRKIIPREVQVNRTARFEIRGQGFGPGASVQFRYPSNNQVPHEFGWIIARYADVDVHQYMIVEALFHYEGYWEVWMWNDFRDQFEPVGCKVLVVP